MTNQRPLRKPPALKLGDTIGVIAPASNVKADWLAAGVRELERLGFRVKQLDSILAHERYFAGNDQRRAAEFQAMLADPAVKAIFAARGGYGSVRLLSLLDDEIIARHPKIVMGYSDVTTLLIYLYQKHGLVTFHGPMVAKDFFAGPDHYDWSLLERVLMRAEPAGAVNITGTQVLRPGRARGRLVGGCLPMITESIGTAYELDTTDAILFIEDIGARPYQIDRLLQHLRQAGKLARVRGFIFGEMTDCVQHSGQDYTLTEVILDCLAEFNGPILFGLTFGHTERNNLTFPLGIEVELDCDTPALTITEAAVS